MRTTIIVSVDLDEGQVEHIAKRSGRPLDRARAEIIGDLECRLHDAANWRDGVSRVSTYIVDPDSAFDRPHLVCGVRAQ